TNSFTPSAVTYSSSALLRRPPQPTEITFWPFARVANLGAINRLGCRICQDPGAILQRSRHPPASQRRDSTRTLPFHANRPIDPVWSKIDEIAAEDALVGLRPGVHAQRAADAALARGLVNMSMDAQHRLEGLDRAAHSGR